MKEIALENLESFVNIFSVDREKHVVILLTIKTFIYRFNKYPELRNRTKLFALTSDWENDGNFFMTVSCCCFSFVTYAHLRLLQFSGINEHLL